MELTPPDETPLPRRLKLSQQLDEIAADLEDRPVSFGEVVQITQGRAYDLLLVLLALPFLSPVPIPFLSTFLGAVIALIGLRLALGLKPWLPESILARKLQPGLLTRVLRAGSGLMRRLEAWLKPRFAFVHRVVFFQRLSGALIAISGVLLLLPLPIPFSNFLPATAVLALASGALERDGAFFFAGCVLFTLTVLFFGAIGLGGTEAVLWLKHLLPFGGGEIEPVGA